MGIRETDEGLFFPFPGFDYWQERRWAQFRPRWNNSTNTGPKQGVYYHVRSGGSTERVILVEGIVDALVVGAYENAAAVLSWRLHPAQIDRLEAIYDKLVYMPDGDVPYERMMSQMQKLPRGSSTIPLPDGEDPASMGKELAGWL
jgi:hypothetical protein